MPVIWCCTRSDLELPINNLIFKVRRFREIFRGFFVHFFFCPILQRIACARIFIQENTQCYNTQMPPCVTKQLHAISRDYLFANKISDIVRVWRFSSFLSFLFVIHKYKSMHTKMWITAENKN